MKCILQVTNYACRKKELILCFDEAYSIWVVVVVIQLGMVFSDQEFL